jgi:two-component system, LytTR family, response regulator
MKTRCIIVDDEPLAIEVIKSHVEKIESFEVVTTCQNALQALESLSKHKIDLIFLDIQMPGIKGTDFIKSLKNPPKVILSTAYREYALEGYELDVVDYLLKPISFERFFKAVTKYLQSLPDEVVVHRAETTADNGFIYMRANKKIHKILFRDILYIECIKDYLTIYTETRSVSAKHTISSFEQKLPTATFLRIHRSFIISLDRVAGFTSHTIDIGGKELPIGRNYSQQVFKALNYSQAME